MRAAVHIISIIFFSTINTSFSQWEIQPLPPGSGKSVSLDFADANHGIVCGGFVDFDSHAKASYTTNRGANWLPASFPDSGKFFYSVKCVNSLAYICGTYQPDAKNTLQINNSKRTEWKAFFLKSTNYGKDWISNTSPDLNKYNNLLEIDFINEEQGIAITNNFKSAKSSADNIIITNNSGSNWYVIYSGDDSLQLDLVSVQYLHKDLIYSAGNYNEGKIYKGVFLKSSDCGISWQTNYIDDLIINNISFSNDSVGFLTGLSSINSFTLLYRTTDSGLNWDLIQTFTEDSYNGVKFLRESGSGLLYGYRILFGDAPIILLTTDYGNSWIRQLFPPTNDLILTDAVILSPDEMYVTGGELFSNGVVLHTSTGGWTFISIINEFASDKTFNLFQNYPNPFNPNTKIRFSIPENSQAKVLVYDELGREVTRLADNELNAGVYEVDWDGNGFSSGVYYYRLQTNSFTETKKMFLVK